MEGKKRYIAIVLFLLIGLTLFAFANPVEDEKGSNKDNGNGKDTSEISDKKNDDDGTNGTLETNNEGNQIQLVNQQGGQQTDNTYANALVAVERAEQALAEELVNVDSETINDLLEAARELIDEVINNNSRAELTERADIVEEALDAIALVEKLEKLVGNAENKEGIKEANDYRTDSQVENVVENLRNEDIKDALEDIISELNLILDDKTAPSYDGIKNNETTKEDVTLTVSDDTEVTVKVTLNGKEIEYTENKAFTEEGVYEVLLVDEAFNETPITFTIDKTSPKFDGLKSGSHYKTIEVKVTDATETTVVVKNMDTGKEVELDETNTLTEDATYYITATDAAGNQTSIWVAIDTKAPKIWGFDETKPTNAKKEVVYASDKFLMTVTIDGKKYTRDDFTVGASNENFSFQKNVVSEGTHTVTAIDKFGNTTTKTFVIDRTAAQVEITKSNNDKSTNKDVTVTLKTNEEIVTPEGWTVVTEGTEFTKVYSENGKYSLTVKDLAGNETEVNFEVKRIDKVAPTATVTKSNNDKSTNKDVTVTIVANEAIYKPEGWTEVKTNKEHEFTKVYSENGKYEVVIKDKAGNETTVKFEVKRIDKVAPTATVTMSNKNGLQSTNQDVTVTIVTNEAIYKPEGWTEVKTNKEHEFTKVYSENGKYSVVITDKAGNQTTVKFEVKRIDKVAPVVTVINPNKYQLEVHSKYVDKGYSAWDAVDKDVTKLIKITYQFQAKGTSQWPFVDELDTSKLGTYKIIYTAYDKAGNTSKGTRVVEIVDTTAPLLTLNGESKITLEAGIDTYEELGATATDNYDEKVENIQPKLIHYRDKDNNLQKATFVDTTKVGTYKIVYTHTDTNKNIGVDASRNDHEYVMRTVVVEDTTAPVMTINGEKEITIEAGQGTYTELGVTVTDNVDATITNLQPKFIHYRDLNNKLEKVTSVDTTRVGTYKIQYEHEDSSNNKAIDSSRHDHKYIIRVVNVVDTINPTLTVKEESIGTDPYYSKVSFALSDSNLIDYFEVNGEKFERTDAKYSDANYDNIKSALVAGKNTIILYDTAGNTSEKTFYMDWTAPTVEVKNWYGSNPYKGADFKLSDNYEIDYIVINGTKYDRTNAKHSDANYQNIKGSLVNGENTFVLYDAAGNSATYTFTLERIAPTIKVQPGTVGTGPYSKLNLQMYDANGVASVVINGTKLPHTGYYVDINDGHAYTFLEGQNTVVVTDAAGNVTTQTFVVDRTHYVYTFDDLKAAFTAGGKAKMMANIDVTEKLVLSNSKSLELDMNTKKLTLADSYAKASSNWVTMIDMSSGSSLKITGNGTVDLEDNYNDAFIIPRGNLTIENGKFLRNAGGTGYISMFVGITNGQGKLIINDGYFDAGSYDVNNLHNNGDHGLNLSKNQYVRVYGGTFVGQNPAYGDASQANTSPSAKPENCQGVFFEGQKVEDTEIPSTYTVTEGTHADGRPTYTVKYKSAQ